MVKLNELQKHELIDWSDEVEEILKMLSEKAQIWRLIHMKNHNIFKRKYYCLIVPVTVLSSITGAANLALGSVASGNETVINLVIGALGIIISVISTLNNIFSFQKRKDEHYRASKDWYRVQRMIDIELSLQRTKRNNVSTFFHLVLQEIERIHEFHPNIREDVIRRFMKRYKNKKLSIDIPEILSIKRTLIFREPILNNTTELKVNKEKQEKQEKDKEKDKEDKDKNDLKKIKNNLEIIIENPDVNKQIITTENKLKKQNTFIDMSEEKDKNNSITSKLGGIFSFVPKFFYKDENKNSTSDIDELIPNNLEPSKNSDLNTKINTISISHQENEILPIVTPTSTPLEQSEKHNEYENNYNFNIYDDSNESKNSNESK